MAESYASHNDFGSAAPINICYGRTVAGTPCELAPGHYPDTHHACHIGDDGWNSWMSWTDEGMADFARIADEINTKGNTNE